MLNERKMLLLTLEIDDELVGLYFTSNAGSYSVNVDEVAPQFNAQLKALDIPLEFVMSPYDTFTKPLWGDRVDSGEDAVYGFAIRRLPHPTKRPANVVVAMRENPSGEHYEQSGDINSSTGVIGDDGSFNGRDVGHGLMVSNPAFVNLDTLESGIYEGPTPIGLLPHTKDLDGGVFDNPIMIDVGGLSPATDPYQTEVRVGSLRGTMDYNLPVCPIRLVNASDGPKTVMPSTQWNWVTLASSEIVLVPTGRPVSEGSREDYVDRYSFVIPAKTDACVLLSPDYFEHEPTDEDPMLGLFDITIPAWHAESKVIDFIISTSSTLAWSRYDSARDPVTGEVRGGMYVLITPSNFISSFSGFTEIINPSGTYSLQLEPNDAKIAYLDSPVSIDTLPDVLPPPSSWEPIIANDRTKMYVPMIADKTALVYLPFSSDYSGTTSTFCQWMEGYRLANVLFGRSTTLDYSSVSPDTWSSPQNLTESTSMYRESGYTRINEFMPATVNGGAPKYMLYTITGPMGLGKAGIKIEFELGNGGVVIPLDDLRFRVDVEIYRLKDVIPYLNRTSDVKPVPINERFVHWTGSSSEVNGPDYTFKYVKTQYNVTHIAYIENIRMDVDCDDGLIIFTRNLQEWYSQDVTGDTVIRANVLVHKGEFNE